MSRNGHLRCLKPKCTPPGDFSGASGGRVWSERPVICHPLGSARSTARGDQNPGRCGMVCLHILLCLSRGDCCIDGRLLDAAAFALLAPLHRHVSGHRSLAASSTISLTKIGSNGNGSVFSCRNKWRTSDLCEEAL